MSDGENVENTNENLSGATNPENSGDSTKVQTPPKATKRHEFVFLHKSKKGKLGANKLRTEKKLGDGSISQSSKVIRFREHMYRTFDPKEAAFIRKSQSFINKQITEVTPDQERNYQRAQVAIHKVAMSTHDGASGDISASDKQAIVDSNTA